MQKTQIVLLITSIFLYSCVEAPNTNKIAKNPKLIKENLLKNPPKMAFSVNAELADNVTYLGMDVSSNPVKPGTVLTLTHYWKVNKTPKGWNLFVHIISPENTDFLNADHVPIKGNYPPSDWKAGDIIRDEHTVTIPTYWQKDSLTVYLGLYKGNERMKIKGPQDKENRLIAGTIKVDIKAIPKPPLKEIIATRTTDTITIDGQLTEAAWSKTPSTGDFVSTRNGQKSALHTEARLMWNDKYLFVAFENWDRDIWSSFTEHDDKLYTQEVVEIFIDPNGDQKEYIELQVNPNGVIFDSWLPGYRKNQNDWDSDMIVAVKADGTVNIRNDVDKSWTVEIAIPWKDTVGLSKRKVTLPPNSGDIWRINFFRLDKPTPKGQQACAWSAPLKGDFHVLDRFGYLRFGE